MSTTDFVEEPRRAIHFLSELFAQFRKLALQTGEFLAQLNHLLFERRKSRGLLHVSSSAGVHGADSRLPASPTLPARDAAYRSSLVPGWRGSTFTSGGSRSIGRRASTEHRSTHQNGRAAPYVRAVPRRLRPT